MLAIFAIFGSCVPTFHGRSEPLPHVREILHALQSLKSIRMVKKYRDKSGRLRVASNLAGLKCNIETITACPQNEFPGLYTASGWLNVIASFTGVPLGFLFPGFLPIKVWVF